jgi:trk system potassium uptake protein TrkH
VAGLVGLTGFILEYGFHVSETGRHVAELMSAGAVGLFLVELVLAAGTIRPWRAFFTARWPALVLTVLLAGELLAVRAGGGSWLAPFLHFFSIRSMTQAYVVVAQFFVIGNLLVNLPRLHADFALRRIRPGAAFVLLFLTLILFGTGLLLLPRAVPEGNPLGFLDALFTSTSAVCVTGLIVRDTATQFTFVGQIVILLLIQLGGLGIMSLMATLSLLLGRGIGIRESSLLRELFQPPMMMEVGRMLRFIVVFTFVAEAIGVVLLYLGLGAAMPDTRVRLFYAVFHAVSAFCNAGFSSFGDSLVSMADSPLVVGTVAGLLIVGGLGFAVVANLVGFWRGRTLRRSHDTDRKLFVQTKVVLMMTGLLLGVATLLLGWLEWEGAFAGRTVVQKVSLAFFQAATTRTAGFYTVDPTLLSSPGLFLMIILMFIGAAPGSTAGGVKITTVAIMWANLRAIAKGMPQARLWGREISPTAVRRTMLVLTGSLVASALGTWVLLVTEGRPFLPTVFEVFSALGTVGLSLGLTAELTPLGRVVVVLLMFIGRLGPLTLSYGLVAPSSERRVRLPQARILVG